MTYEEYLAHHGILGMRWGKRNGPPYPLLRRNMTSAERKANPATESSSKEESKKVKEPKQIKVETPTGEKTNPNAKPLREMSDKELKTALNRLEDEKKYRVYELNDVTSGKKWIGAMLLTFGGVAAATYAASLGKKAGDAGAKKTSDWVSNILGNWKYLKEIHGV